MKTETLGFASSPAKTLQNELCLKLKVNIGSSVNCVFQTALLKKQNYTPCSLIFSEPTTFITVSVENGSQAISCFTYQCHQATTLRSMR